MTDIGPALLCYDGSDRAERAMRRAATLLRSRHAVVIRVSHRRSKGEWRRLLRAAQGEEAACIVVGHRPSVKDPGSTAYGLVQHADRPVLVVPSQGV